MSALSPRPSSTPHHKPLLLNPLGTSMLYAVIPLIPSVPMRVLLCLRKKRKASHLVLCIMLMKIFHSQGRSNKWNWFLIKRVDKFSWTLIWIFLLYTHTYMYMHACAYTLTLILRERIEYCTTHIFSIHLNIIKGCAHNLNKTLRNDISISFILIVQFKLVLYANE